MFVLLFFIVALGGAQDCGRTPIQPDLLNGFGSSNIVGGSPARPYSWPWQAEICVKGFGGAWDLFCGGSLIAPEWVLSAAHCIDGLEQYIQYFGIKLGTYDYYDDSEDGELVLEVEEFHKHPEYGSPMRFSHDIALLKIKGGPVNYTDHIQPICLPASLDGVVVEGKLAYITGWGATSEGGEVSGELRQAIVPFLDMPHCENEYPGEVDDTMECAGRKGVDSCQGDSGGPLVTMHDDNERWYQAGIVSWGDGCGQENHAGVYSRPSVHCDFIKEVTGLDICLS